MNSKERLRQLAATVLVGVTISVYPAIHANAADGDLDPSFGDNGRVSTDFFGGYDEARAVAIEKNGKIVAAGRAFNSATASHEFALARYRKDGALDSSFGDGGKVTTHLPANTADASTAIANAVAIQHDGRILAAGSVQSSVTSQTNFAVLRYDNRGRLDKKFGDGGVVITEFAGLRASANDLALQLDGKIVVVGSAAGSAGGDVVLARYNPDGSLDGSFGVGGKVITDITTSDLATAVHLTLDGKILVAGQSCPPGLTCDPDLAGRYLLLRYNPDGGLDTSFGDQGKVISRLGGCHIANDIDVAPDGKIVLVGSLTATRCSFLENSHFAVLRYNPDGSPDTTLGTIGEIGIKLGGPRGGSIATAVAITFNGFTPKILVGGYYRFGPACINVAGPQPCDFGLARFNWDGTIDVSFGASGEAIADFGDRDDRAFDLAIQKNGKIVQAGRTANSSASEPQSSTSDFAIARFLSDDCPLPFLHKGLLRSPNAPGPFNAAFDLLDDIVGCGAPHL